MRRVLSLIDPIPVEHAATRGIQLVALAALVGCSGGTSGPTTETTTEPDTATSTATESATGGGLSQTEFCGLYVSCVAMASPPALGEILETYGPDGTCWGSNQDIADTCDNACYEGLKMWNSVSPEIVECAPPPNGIPPTMDHHFFFAVPDATPDDQYVSDLYFHAFVKIVDDGHIDLTVQPHLVNSSSEPPPGELIGMSLTYKMVVVEPNGYFDTGTIDYMMPAGSGSFGGIVVEMGFRGVFHEEVICGDFHGVIPGQYGEDDYPLDGALIGVPVEEIGEVAVDYEDLCE